MPTLTRISTFAAGLCGLLAAIVASPAHAEDTPAPAPGSTDSVVYLAQTDDGALAQDDDDAPDDSVKAERDAVKKGDTATPTTASSSESKEKKRVIKTVQKKNFIKVHRFEFGPSLGFVANDPFLNRYIVGGVADYHLTEVFAAELDLGYAPILGQGGADDPDWKQLSVQLLTKNSVSPDISKLTAHGSIGLAFSPIYGKAAVGKKIIIFDIYGHFGLGFTQTQDDLVALQAEGDPAAILTQNEIHPTTVIGGGARVAFSQGLAVRVEGKSMSYIEDVNSTTLEMKNNVILQASLSFFIPGME
jgi:outer membrane beta-barrel protein